mmetsp:Transcript_19811/g.38827  ORF Transcript_19811/g.38827 Transcript_19811/m.38827 type:complete len:425 (+) Transcript_19811:436-1710(+)|eukprot:CAMPEP_0171513570 /NCGR_PEP_ID=MMETSP0959-20130129/2314_1 /TAXON_ID=87120 /ORGANISM="Aurantiochytrium limacinum, Strain ATCCMYA-1381" /LENGTH=424 /DNA_ID=CAMNT_0012051703 /DNA_START=311 /DNA_END=1585 /DNA_ORIENTATION=-
MGNNSSVESDVEDTRQVFTLLAFGAGHPVTCVHRNHETGLILVGNANGASQLLFPVLKSGAQQQGLSTAPRDSSDLENGSASQTNFTPREYRSLLLRSRSNEAVRAAYIDANAGMLFIAIGDACVQVFDLKNLRLQDPDHPEHGIRHEMYAYGRMHTFGACVNAFVLHYQRHFLLILRRSVSVYELCFPCVPNSSKSASGASSSSPRSGVPQAGGHTDRLGELLDPSDDGERITVEQHDTSLTFSANTVPCSFDGRYVVVIRTDEYGEFNIEVRDWDAPGKDLIRSIPLYRRPLDVLIPEAVQVSGDKLIAVINQRTIVGWSVSSGQELFRCATQKSDLIVTNLYNPTKDCEEFIIVSIDRKGKVILWAADNPLQTIQVPSHFATFDMSGPYYLEPDLTETSNGTYVLSSLVFNDDTGVHMLTF